MQMTFDFSTPARAAAPVESNDYHRVPASEKQLRYARQLAARLRKPLPDAVLGDRQRLSDWIDAHRTHGAHGTHGASFSQYPSSKQVAFAERIARIKRRAVPDACFRDRTLMSRWIDSNL